VPSGCDRTAGQVVAFDRLAAPNYLVAPRGFAEYALGMTRRRLILAACVATVALGAAWCWYTDQLTVEEQRLVGVWRSNQGVNPRWDQGMTVVWHFRTNRTCSIQRFDTASGQLLIFSNGHDLAIMGQWHARADQLSRIWEERFLDRLRRLLPSSFPGSSRQAAFEKVRIRNVSEDELVFESPDGTQRVLTRDRGD
jgi:hypothetical protein